jgi:hypothetical protein
VNVENARKCQPAESGADNRDWSIHHDSFVVRGRRISPAAMEHHSMIME